jgi:hypothetical protein
MPQKKYVPRRLLGLDQDNALVREPCGVREDNVYFFAQSDLALLQHNLMSGGKSEAFDRD